MREVTAKLIRYSDESEVKSGETLLLDNNLYVTLVQLICGPCGDDETGEFWPGEARVRMGWGSEETVNVNRLGCHIEGAGEDGSIY